MSKIIYENCDCMIGMARYPDKYFNLAIIDPPYGIDCVSMDYATSGAVMTKGNAAAKKKRL